MSRGLLLGGRRECLLELRRGLLPSIPSGFELLCMCDRLLLEHGRHHLCRGLERLRLSGLHDGLSRGFRFLDRGDPIEWTRMLERGIGLGWRQ